MCATNTRHIDECICKQHDTRIIHANEHDVKTNNNHKHNTTNDENKYKHMCLPVSVGMLVVHDEIILTAAYHLVNLDVVVVVVVVVMSMRVNVMRRWSNGYFFFHTIITKTNMHMH